MYDGFISYSHAADRPLAKRLQRALHTIGRPWYKPRALKVFRDDVSLAASPDLWSSIRTALENSRTFTLLACPESAASPWVNREVSLWRQQKSRDTFLIALTGGELVWDERTNDFDWSRTTALPDSLQSWFQAEPLWVDLRDPESLTGAEFRARAATLAAGVHGIPKDNLISEDSKQQRRLVAVLASLLTLALAAGGIAVWQQRVAVAERDRATEQARLALSRALSEESRRLFQTDPNLAITLALTAWSAARSTEAKAALMRTLDETGHLEKVLSPGTDTVTRHRPANVGVPANVAISADGAVTAHAYSDGPIVLKDRTLPGPSWALALNGDGSLLASTTGTVVQLWNTADGSLRREIPFGGAPERIALSADGHLVAVSGGSTGGLTPNLGVWNADTGQPLLTVEGGNAPGGPLEFRDGKLHTAQGRTPDAPLAIFDPETGTWSALPASRTWPRAMATGAASTALVDGTSLELWEGTTKTRAITLDEEACCVSMSADGHRIVAGVGADVLLHDRDLNRTARLFHHPTKIRDLRISDDGTRVVSISENGTAVVTSPGRDNRLRAKATNQSTVEGVAVSASGTAAISGATGTSLRDVRTLTERKALPPAGRRVRLSPDGEHLTTEGVFLGDNRHLVTVGTGGKPVVGETPVTTPSPDDQQVEANLDGTAIAVVTRARTAASGGTDIVLWRWEHTGLTDPRQINFPADVQSFAVSSDGRRVSATDADGRVLLNDGTATRVFGLGQPTPKTRVAFAGDLVAQLDPATGEFLLWDTADGTPVGSWQHAGQGAVTGFAATADRGLLTAREDGALAVWEADPAAWVRTLCPLVSGELSAEERQRRLGGIDVAWPCG
ncbi:TIR domain-containing protein [Lentzea fradiae]|uniref:TIR domain-containing protein n=1 Tax=Lentzea fradiae TaxID=200378 RepID=A0A1G7NGN0_9PSEU|nr:TIR domain-containing protein [Lentzea fradiae]SDF73238.1 TIR domain-containing protein [Lentzea fradiae]